MIIDSFSQAFKEAFPGDQSFGARARAQDFLYNMIKTTGAKYPDTFFLLNHHVTIHPHFGTVDLSGGASVVQNSKITLYIEKLKGMFDSYALIQVYRYPDIKEWGRSAYLRYTDEGFVDASKEEIEELKKKVQEARRKKRRKKVEEEEVEGELLE